jgi:hypothetical protein
LETTEFRLETERPRQLWLHRGHSETLNPDPKKKAQVTSAREACNSGDNKSDPACCDDMH